jgi:hypothetical protein
MTYNRLKIVPNDEPNAAHPENFQDLPKEQKPGDQKILICTVKCYK